MTYAPFSVLLDANVLIPLSVCDIFLGAANEGLIQISWTEHILEETRRNLVTAIGLPEAQASKRIAAMKNAFPEAMVSGHEWLIPVMRNHEKDRHVLAAAIHAKAQTIVTSNLRDFREEHLPAGIQAQDPDTFLQHLLSQDREAMLELLHAQARALRKPPMTFEQFLAGMARSVPQFTEQVRRLLPPSNARR